ncbi:MAG: hypothetical protein E7360_06650 [Clostridiales bacterium]|nr:hypothetical protein [Clostridiales bacterium]
MKEKKKNSVIAAVCTVIAIVIGSTFIINAIPKEEPKPDEPPVIETPGGNETPGENETPEEPELLTRIELTFDNVAYEDTSGKGIIKYKSIVTMADVPIANENIDGNVLKLVWRSGCTVSVNVDLSKYDVENATHLTFWFGSDVLNFSEGWAKHVQWKDKTIFNSQKSLKSSDLDLDAYFARHPDVNPADVLKCGEWKKYEVPIADVLEFYETNGRISFFNFMSSGLTVNNVYLANVQFENITE